MGRGGPAAVNRTRGRADAGPQGPAR